jgi:hypothetical protein
MYLAPGGCVRLPANSLIPTALFLVLLAVLGLTTNAAAQQTDAQRNRPALVRVTPEELKSLPTASWINPAIQSFPAYARTTSKCVGDARWGIYFDRIIGPKPGAFQFHTPTEFVSVAIDRKDEGSIASLRMAPAQRDELRGRLQQRVQEIDSSNLLVAGAFFVAGIPFIPVSGAVAGTLWIVGGFSMLVQEIGASERDHLLTLAALLRSNTIVYRSVTPLQSPTGAQFVRYAYGIQPNDQDLSIVLLCYFARRPK